ncbi:MAG: 2-amino-4-hydroxy-6-hydroxymethyldihydropteridine diphosphokinase [Pseudomonadota bacterium]|nr:2-amino-4-hydroxy-6-hydroxymethyldihydropteridine diphosphokinase [Pseudomonadota bacterium]
MDNSNRHDDAVIVALGSNLAGRYASRQALLEGAVTRFPAVGLTLIQRSNWWRSAAWPDPAAPDYLNGVALVETDLDPREVLAALLDLEAAFGRRRGAPNASRTLDLDLVAFGRRIVREPGFTIPHPSAHRRRFVMAPLAEIAPAWVHPLKGRTAAALAASADVGADAAPVEAPPRFNAP